MTKLRIKKANSFPPEGYFSLNSKKYEKLINDGWKISFWHKGGYFLSVDIDPKFTDGTPVYILNHDGNCTLWANNIPPGIEALIPLKLTLEELADRSEEILKKLRKFSKVFRNPPEEA